MYTTLFKRVFDFIFSFVGFILISPMLLLVTLLLAMANKGKPLFFQIRPGKNEKLFKIIKFKTMTDARNKEGNLLPDAQRLTKTGCLVRKTSLDELPQLLNVIKGDMSLIDPRPLQSEYISLYNKEQRKRHCEKPGITGWAQVNGRNAISWEEKFKLDVFYVKHLSFLLDIKILFLTIKKMFKREAISSKTSVTMELFKGN